MHLKDSDFQTEDFTLLKRGIREVGVSAKTNVNGEVIGPAKSLYVNSGDVIDLEVFAKYNAPTTNGSDVGNFLNAIVGALGLSPGGGSAINGPEAYNTFNSLFSAGAWIPPSDYEDQDAPKAFLNYLLFDENFNLVDAGFDQVGQAGATTHDYMSLHVRVKQKGYLYIYLSNENDKIVDVYFDDFKVVHHTGVEAVNEYYPFGLSINALSFQKPSLTKNPYLYNGKEIQDELDLGWLDYGARMYMPEIARFHGVDSKAQLLEMSSPYVYALNSPLTYLDKDGNLPILINGRVMSDSERASSTYWTMEIINTIKNSGIPNPGGQFHYVDGDRFLTYSNRYLINSLEPTPFKGTFATGNDPEFRSAAGYRAAKMDFQSILSKLERDPETHKIIEKIQIYTHSRGAAFGEGYVEGLLEMIKKNAYKFADT